MQTRKVILTLERNGITKTVETSFVAECNPVIGATLTPPTETVLWKIVSWTESSN